MQSDFQMLVVSESEDPFIALAEPAISQCNAGSWDVDVEKAKYPNISEEVLVFLVRFKSTTRTWPAKAEPKLVDGCGINDLASSSCSTLALPPPRRFDRMARCALQLPKM